MEEFSILAAVAVAVIVAVAHFAPRLGVAAPVLLVLAGIGASYVPGTPHLDMDPHLILTVVLPPLLYAAAITVPAVEFRRNFSAISSLAVLLVIVSALVTGLLLHWLVPEIPLAIAIALGAVIAPPDAVAATSVGKRLGLPPRLLVVLEGEGLVNDATALVLLRSAVAAGAGGVSLLDVTADFLRAVVIGLLVGVVIGLVAVRVRAFLDDPVLITAVSLTVPFVAFVPAEELHASGVLAVVVAGLVTGYQSSHHFEAQDRVTERINWRTVQLLLENGVFLLMGYQIESLVSDVRGSDDLGVGGTVLLGLLLTVVLVALRMAFMIPLTAWLRAQQRRGVAMAPRLGALQEHLGTIAPEEASSGRRLRHVQRRVDRKLADLQQLERNALGWRGGAVLGWSGMRGVVTLAAAQSLPADTPWRSQLILVAFVVALVTLVVQGTSLPWVIRVLGVRGTDEQAARVELDGLLTEISQVMTDALDNPDLVRSDGRRFSERALAKGRTQQELFTRYVSTATPEDQARLDEHRELRMLLLEAGAAALRDCRTSGEWNSGTLARAQSLLDAEVIHLENGVPGR